MGPAQTQLGLYRPAGQKRHGQRPIQKTLPSPHKEAARIEWEYSQEVQRHNGCVSMIGPALGLSATQVDALFIAAAEL